ncbi:MAG: methyltransferase [Chloroflexi bacterium]|nr:methyltransferase [Chloroflexota bacterium]MCI0576667.1 methyltransferase [Chloroflexota bacterium]MCI0647980.1 methyltransferase [Chloroflexota bacterium]MCI0726810.1 methyltransferase [Chloroflexota bacterium]
MFKTDIPLQPTSSWLGRAIGAVVRRWLALRYRALGRRYGRLVLEEIDGVPLIVLPEVFNPVLLRTGQFMVRSLVGLPLERGVQVLDLGTGSGVGAIFAARRGGRVTAVDINPDAVRCARMNVLLNRLEEEIEVLQGDLFTPVAGRRFDLVLFNPPFHRGRPRSGLDHAWRGEDVFERFAGHLADALRPGGRALVVLSSDGDGDDLLALLRERGFAINVVAQKNLVNELLTMYEVRE